MIDGNPTVDFYKKSGATLGPFDKLEEIGGVRVRELSMVWESLVLANS